MRKRITYANVAATLALVFSMSGGALAANHYLISSTKQISPKVLKKLKGATGAKGATGTTGATGKEGAPGAKGETGTKGETGPSHAYSAIGGTSASVTVPAGSYAVSATGEFVNNGAKIGAGECTLTAPGANTNFGWASIPNTGEEEGRESEIYGEAMVSNQLTATLKAAGTISEDCGNGQESQSEVHARETTVTAILVGGLN